MSRRHHGRSHGGGRYRHDPTRHAPGSGPGPGVPPAPVDTSNGAPPAPVDAAGVAARQTSPEDALPRTTDSRPEVNDSEQRANAPQVGPGGPRPAGGMGRDRSARPPAGANGRPNGHGPGQTNGHGPAPTNGHGPVPAHGQDRATGCTAPQLRRFIKSRPYVPMHELRRRFAIDGEDDDVTQVSIEQGNVYVGLPSREGSLLGELLRGGEIGYELSLDPRTPVVVGVYPMRPIPRS